MTERVSEALTEEFCAGFSVTNIKNYRQFSLMFSSPSIGQTLSDQLEIADNLPESPVDLKRGIGQTLSDQFSIPLPDNLSILKGNEQIFAAKYLTYLPTEEQLRKEIEEQKAIFALQNANTDEKPHHETVTER